MKKLLYSFAFMLSCLYSYNQCSPVDSSLLLKLNFSNNDIDSSSYLHPILSIGSPVLAADRNNVAGNAMDFDGVGAHLVVADSNTNYKSNFPITISCWINPDSLNSTNPIFTNEDYQGAYTGVWLQITGDGNLALSYGDGTGNGSGSRVSAIGTQMIAANQWTHIVATVRGAGDFSLYINGVPETFNVDGNGGNMVYINNDSMPSRVATFFKGNSTPRFFDGRIDDLRFWNRDIFLNQVEVLYTGAPAYQDYFKGDTLVICNNETDTLRSSPGFCSHLWSDGSTSASIALDGSVLGVGSYLYILHYTEQPGFTYFDSIVVKVENCVSGFSETERPQVHVYPNPASNQINIDFYNSGIVGNTTVELYNVAGALVRRENVSAMPYSLQISECPIGMYLLQIKDGSKVYRQKLVKE